MRKHLLQWMLLLVAFMVPWTTHAQLELTVADGTGTNNYVPVYGFYVDDFLRCQTIYPSDDLGEMMGGTIMGLTYYLSTPATDSWGSAIFVVRITEVDATTLSGFVDMTGAETVYTGALDGTQSTMSIEFSTPYTYQGGNLLIEVYSTQEGTYESASFSGISASNASWQGYSSTSWSSVTGSAQNFIPKTTFSYAPGGGFFCYKPGNAAVVPSATAAVFSWVASESAVSYEWLYTEAGTTAADVDWSSASSTTNTSVDIDNLDPMTSYVAYVRSNCGEEFSNPSRVPFVTACATRTVTASNPYICGFEDGTPMCWEVLNGEVTVKTSTSNVHAGSAYLDFRGAVGNAIALPEFADGGTTGLQLTFWTRPESFTNSSCGTFSVGYMTDITNDDSYVELDSWAYNTFSAYERKEVSLTTVPAGARVVMKQIDNATSWYWYVDDVEVSTLPTCIKPNHLELVDIDSNSVELSWTPGHEGDNTWEVEYSTDGENWVSSGFINNNPYQILHLSSKTIYQVRVRTICDSHDQEEGISAWSDPVSFRTDCGVFVVDNDHSFSENGSLTTTTIDCWEIESEGDASWYSYTGSGFSGDCFGISNGTAGESSTLVSPTLQLTVPCRMTFWYKYNGTGNFTVLVSTDGGTTRDPLHTVANAENWSQRSFDLSGYTGNNVNLYLQFETTGGSSSDVCYLDELVVELMPSCFEPTDFAVMGVTSGDVTLGWSDNNSATPASWTVAYGHTATFNLEEEAYDTYTAYTNEATVPNLDEFTSYSFAVRTNCSGNDHSAWSQVITTTTAPDCGAMAPRQFEIGDGTGTATYPFYYSTTNYTYGGSYVTFTPEELAANDLYEGQLRGIGLNYASSTELTMPIKVYARLHTNGLVYSSSSNCSDTNDMTLVYEGEYTFQKGWNDIVFSTPFEYDGTSGIEFFFRRDAAISQSPAFYYTSAGSYSTGYYTCYAYGNTITSLTKYTTSYRPNMRFTMCVSEPTCLAPLNFSKSALTPTSVTLTWTNRSDAEAWTLHFGNETLDISVDEVEMEGDEVSYVINGLEPNTSYSYTLTSHCGGTDESDATQALTIHTPCLPVTVDAENPFFEGGENGSLSTCWINEHIAGSGTSLWTTSTTYKLNGTYSVQLPDMSSGTVTNLVTPGLNIDASNASNGVALTLSVYRNASGTSYPEEGVKVWLNNMPSTEGATQLMYITRNINYGDRQESSTGWYTYTEPIPVGMLSETLYVIFEGISRYGSATYIDDITVEALPNCMEVSDLAVSGEPAVDEVTLTWNEYDADRPMEYLVEYTVTGVEDAVSDTAHVLYTADMELAEVENGIAYTLTGLTANTPYSVRVAAVCTAGDTSAWSAATSFRTACSYFDLPYTMGFELADVNSVTTLPYCWTRYNSAEEAWPKVDASNANSGSRSLKYSVSASGATAEVALLPRLSAEAAATANRLVLFVKSSSLLDSALTVGIMTDPTDYTTFTEVAHINATATYAKHKINLPAGAGYVAIRGNRPTSGSSTISVYVDDVTLEVQPNCELPEGFAKKGNPTSNSAVLTWIDAEGEAWEVERTYNDAENEQVVDHILVSANDIVRGTVNPDSVYYTLTGLNARTDYSLRLRTSCGNENSAWADNTVTLSTQNNETAITAVNLNGQYSADIDAESHTVTVIMPYGSNLSALGGTFTKSFGATADTNGVTISSFSNNTDFSSPMIINIKAQDPTFVQPWTIQVLIESCARPMGLLATNVDKYNFDLTVLPNTESANTNFQIVYSTEEMDAAALEAADKIDFEYTGDVYPFTHLNRGTTYHIYVRGNCGGTYSEWANLNVTTQTLSICNTVANGTTTVSCPVYGTWTDHPNHTQSIYPASMLTSLEGKTIYSLHYYVSSGSSANWEDETFYVKVMETEETSLSNGFITDLTDATTVYTGTLTASVAAGMTIILNEPFVYTGGNLLVDVNMPQSSGNYTAISFTAMANSGSSRYAYDANAGTHSTSLPKVDFCYEDQVCPAPVANDVVLVGTGTNAATGSWQTAAGDFANTYDVRVVTAGSTDYDNAVFSADNLPADQTSVAITGLSPSTDYEFYVRVRCNADGYDDGYSEWSEPKAFRTYSNCREPQQLAVQLVSKTSANISWVNGSNENGQPTQDNNFQYRVSSTPLDNVDSYNEDGIVGNNENGTADVTITGLQPNNTYYFYVANNCGGGVVSPNTMTIIEMPVPCITPTDVHTSDLGRYNATLAWTGDSLETGVTYELYYGTEDVENLDNLIGNMDDIDDTTVALTGLQRATTYYVYVRTNCPAYGASNWSEVYSFTTEDYGYDCDNLGTEVTLGTGTTSNNQLPIAGWYHHGYTQQLFLANEIGQTGAINSIKFNYFLSNPTTRHITIYMGTTNQTSLSSGWITPGDMTEVLAAQDVTFDNSASNWYTIALDQPFQYDGGNLLVAVHMEQTASESEYGNTARFYVSSASSMARYYQSDGTAAIVANGVITNGAGTVLSTRNNIKFGFCGLVLACPTMEAPEVSNVTNNSATISWQASEADHIASYELIVAAEEPVTDFENANIIDGLETTTYEADWLEANTDYYVYVRTNCNTDEYQDGWSVWSPAATFRTQSNCYRPSGFVAEAVTSNSATLIWHRGNADVQAWEITDGDENNWTVTVDNAEIFGENNDSVRYTVTGLEASSNYTLQVMSNCLDQDNGVSDYAEQTVALHTLNNEALITAFSLSPLYPAGIQMADAVIDNESSTIDVTVRAGVDLATLTQIFTTSPNVARVEVAGQTVVSGGTVDFTAPVVYRVYAQDTNIYRDWTVTVVPEACATVYGFAALPARVRAELSWNIGDVTVENFDFIVSDTVVTDFEAWATEQNIQTINVPGEEMARSYTMTGLERGTTYHVYLKNPCTDSWDMAQYKTFTTQDLAACVEIAQGTTTNSNVPVWGTWADNPLHTQSLYPEEMLTAMMGYTIDSLVYHVLTGSSANWSDETFYVKVKVVDGTSLADGMADTTGATTVYTGTLTASVADGMVVRFDQPFTYTGGNLLIDFSMPETSGDYTSCTFLGSSVTNASRHARGANDGSSNAVDNFLPWFTFCYENSACPAVTEASAENIGSETATLTWTASDGDFVSGYDVVISENEITDFENVQPTFTTTATSYELENLVSYTNYYAYIRANCDAEGAEDGSSTWVPVSFRTSSACHTADDLTATLTDRNAAHITWTNDQNSPVQYVLSTTMLDEDALAAATVVDLEATNEFDAENLNFEQTYFFYVRHNCGDEGASPWQMTNFTTTTECPWVVDAEAMPYFNAAVIDWTDGEFSPATSWRLVLDTLDENEEPVEVFNQVVTSHPYTVLGLNAETMYEVSIYAICGQVESDPYNALNFTTPATPGDCETVADGTETTTYNPIYGLWMDDPQGTQTIYPASMLTNLVGQEITSLHYHVTNTGTSDMGSDKSMKVWMAEVSVSDLSDGFQSIDNATLVYDGTVSQSDFSIEGGFTVTFDEPYIYNGGNLLIAFQNNEEDAGSYCTITFAAMAAQNGSRYGYGADNYSFSGTGTVSDFLPTVDFCVTPSDCHAVRNLASNVTDNGANVTWLPGGSETQWNVVVSNTELDAEALAAGQPTQVTDVNYSMTGLSVDADYYIYVQPICDAGEGVNGEWRMTHFVTAAVCSAPATAVAVVDENGEVTFTVTAGEAGEPVSYDYEYWIVGDEENVTSGTSEDAEWTLNGFQEAMTYAWHVRANCGETDGNSRWTDGNNIYICGTVVVTETNPYVEDFTSLVVSCWSAVANGENVTASNYTTWGIGTANNVTWAFSSGRYGPAYLLSPNIELPDEGRASLTFRERTVYQSASPSYTYGNYSVYVIPEGSSLSQVEAVWTKTPTTTSSTATPIDAIDLSDYLGQTFRLVFVYEGNNSYQWQLTDVTVAMEPAYSVTANVTATADERGSVEVTSDEQTSDGRYYNEPGATLTATANETYTFVNWTDANGTVISTEAVLTVLPTSDTVLYANFDTASYTLTAFVATTDADKGSVTLDGMAPAEGQTTISITAKYSSVHTVTASAAQNYTFSHWGDLTEGDADYASTTRTVTMPNSNLSIRAFFDYQASITERTDAQTVCDKYVLYRTDNSIVATWTTSGQKEITYDDPTDGRIHLVLDLTVNHSSSTGFHPEAQCDSYTWTRTDGTTEEITESVNGHTYAYTSVEGCPSVDTLYLTINTSNSETVAAQMGCDSYRYTFSDQTQSTEVFTESTEDAVVHTTTAAGCDSTIHFALTVNASTQNTTVATACDEYTWEVNNQTYTTVGDIDDQYVTTNAAGCPHTEYLDLTIVSSENLGGEETQTVCDSVLWRGQYRTTTGDHTYTYSVGVCEGTDILHLTVNHSTHTTTTADECDTYTWNRADGEEVVYTASAEEVFTYENTDNCPSADTLHLTIRHSTSTRVNTGACDSYTWTRGDGTTAEYTQSVTDELYSYTSTEGCASTDTLTLSIGTSIHSTTTVEACGKYVWAANGNTYTQGGTKYHIDQTPEGCPIQDTLILTVKSLGQYIDVVEACDSVEWHGHKYYQNIADATDTIRQGSANGCDSVVTLNLTINASTQNTTVETACDEYTWEVNNQTYNTAGDITDQVVSTNDAGCPHTEYLQLTLVSSGSTEETLTACDSLLWRGVWRTASDDYTYEYTIGDCSGTNVLHLTVNPSYHQTITEEACDSYIWETSEQTYTESTVDSRTFQSVEGCDSVLTLNLTINPSYQLTDNVSTCTAYEWNGTTYTESTTQTATLTATTGCDSTVTLNLTISDVITTDVYDTACNSYTWENQEYTESTTDSRTLQSITGCDSVVTLHLTIYTPYELDDYQTACGSYEWNGTTYTESTTQTATLTASTGCDSTVTLHLTISNAYNTSEDVTTCGSYTWTANNQTYTASTVESVTLEAVNGCDSVVTLNLTMVEAYAVDTFAMACNEFTWHGTTYTESTETPTYTYESVGGCDSVVTLHLTINDAFATDVNVTVCNSYTWEVNNVTYTETTTASETLQSVTGCDSVVTLHLTISDAITTDIFDTACNSYIWDANGVTYNASANPSVTLQGSSNCDSIVTLHLTINHDVTSDDYQTACGSYVWNGTTYTESTTDSRTLQSVDGCDSTVTLHLTINNAYNSTDNVTACGSYTWAANNQTYTASTNVTVTLEAVNGCDSNVTLNLTMVEGYASDTVASACDAFTWHGTTYTASTNTPTYTYESTDGCDSVVTLHLTVKHSSTSIDRKNVCDSYAWHGTTYTASTNTPTYTTTNAAGCDSTVTLNLTIRRSTTSIDEQEVCDSYVWHGTTYTASTNTPTYVTTNAAGCDSTVTLHLTVNHSSSVVLNDTACDSYTWSFNGQTYTESITLGFTRTNAAGCDSIVTLKLVIDNSEHSHEYVSNCGSYTWAVNGRTYNQSGVKTYSATTPAGCPIRDTLTLTILPSYTSSLNETACDSYTWNGQTFTQTTNYSDTLTAVNGCDSIVSVNLTIDYSEHSHEYVTTCGSYTWAANGRTYNQGGVKTYNTTTTHGCPVRDTLTLTLLSAFTSSFSQTACDSYTWNGTVYTESGDHTQTLTAVNNCDSVVTLHLTVNYGEYSHEYVTSCGAYTWAVNGRTYNQSGEKTNGSTTAQGCPIRDTLTLTIHPAYTSSFTRTVCDSYTWNGTVYTESGDHTQTLTAVNNCDSVVTLHLNVNHSERNHEYVTNCGSYTWPVDGRTYNLTGMKTYSSTTAQGCPIRDTLSLTVLPIYTIPLVKSACDFYRWNGAVYTESTIQTVALRSVDNCDSIVTLHLTVNHTERSHEYVTHCGPYTWAANGRTYNQSGMKTYSDTNANGCAVRDTLTLTILTAYNTNINETACDRYTWYGTTYTRTGEPTHTLTAANGCDSVITLHLTINNSTESNVTVAVSNNELPYVFAGQTFAEFGQYDIVVANVAGCDSTIHLTLNHNTGIEEADALAQLKVYPNPTSGRVQIGAEWVDKIEVLDLVGRRVALFEKTNTFDLSNLAAGTYTLRITMPEGTTLRKIVKR